jgi:glucose-1-phosphate adenylyltransferase
MTTLLRQKSANFEERTLALLLAGGNGTRLSDLTRSHAKPALPFAGQYRNIDFPLSNCVNSGIRRIAMLTQYKAHSLIKHVVHGWDFLRPETGEFIELWPAQQRTGENWYAGTADAVYQNLDLIREHAPDYVIVLAGDHVYKMDYRPMLEAHVASGADATVGCVEVSLEEASAFGVMGVDWQDRVVRFDEKPLQPIATPMNPRVAMASMGIYVFDREFLARCLTRDARRMDSSHDFGRDVFPAAIETARIVAYRFRNARSTQGYWRDVGTLDSYWRANMELVANDPALNLHDTTWPIWTHQRQCPPPRFVGGGVAQASIVSPGCSVMGRLDRTVLSRNCRIEQGAELTDSVVLPDACIGRDCRIQRAIIDTGCTVPDGSIIGYDSSHDARHYQVSPGQVVLVTAEMIEAMGDHVEPRQRSNTPHRSFGQVATALS